MQENLKVLKISWKILINILIKIENLSNLFLMRFIIDYKGRGLLDRGFNYMIKYMILKTLEINYLKMIGIWDLSIVKIKILIVMWKKFELIFMNYLTFNNRIYLINKNLLLLYKYILWQSSLDYLKRLKTKKNKKVFLRFYMK